MTYGKLPPTAYSSVAKLLHWFVALGVLTLVPVGIVMMRIGPGPLQNNLFDFHKSLGALVLALMILRLGYRAWHGSPQPEPSLARWQRAASSAVHGLLYVLLFVQPLLGWAAMSAYGDRTPFFGLFSLPRIVSINRALADQLMALHGWVGWLLALLVLMHVAAALQHYFIHRDGVLQRMLPSVLGGRKA